MTLLELKRKINEITSRLNTDAVPISFLYGVTEIRPTDIIIGCDITGDKLTLIIDLKERRREVNTEKQTCGACFAFPPNLNDEAYCDFCEFHCRASGLVVKADTSACGMYEVDPKQEGGES